ncbi:MAG: hypothetical protein [Bacteriophage sp.]|nr:MAG: hypothetical protein [Bacteriophage sp.]
MAVAAPIAAWAAANAGTIAAVSTVASVAAQGYSMYQQQQQAKQESEYQKNLNEQTNLQAAASYDDLTPAEIDANRQAQEAALNQQAESFQAKGRVNVFAAAAGTLGGSVDSMLFDIDQQKDKNINQILTQRESGLYSIKQQAEGIRQGAISRQDTRSISKPSWVEGALKIGGSVVSGLDKYGRMNETFKLQDKVGSNQVVRGGV